MESLDLSFLALSHPVRRRILTRLAQGPASVSEAARGTPASKAGITKHVRILERAGLVERTVHGRNHVLTLQPAVLDAAAAWIASHR